MAENKTAPTNASVDEFILGVENKRRRSDALILLQMYKDITKCSPVMWGPSIIGFGEYHYSYESGRDGQMPAAAFAPRKSNLVLYVGDSFSNAKNLYASLGKHKKSVACVYINKLDDVDLDVLSQIVSGSFAEKS